MINNQVTFGSRLGVVLATVGCAIGLGSVWCFPYMLGVNEGAAFLLVYILFTVFLGIPMIVAELFIGRYSRSNTVGSFKKMTPETKWCWIEYNGILVAFLILNYYSAISGWTLEYVWQMLSGHLYEQPDTDYTAGFQDFVSDAFRPISWMGTSIGLTYFVITSSVKKGVERASKIMMPLLFLILLIMCVRSVTLPNTEAGLFFLPKLDSSKLTSPVVLSTLGQAFFSLSLGMGCLITYSPYFGKDTNMQATAWQVTIINTLVAVLAGIMIFPVVLSFDIIPSASAEFAFIMLSSIFGQLPLSGLWSCIFYILLMVTVLTSTISLYGVTVACVLEEPYTTHRKAALIVSLGVFFPGIFSSLSFGVMKGLTAGDLVFFSALGYLTARITPSLGGMLTCIFMDTRIDKKVLRAELANEEALRFHLFGAYVFFVKCVAPIATGIVFLNELGVLKWITDK